MEDFNYEKPKTKEFAGMLSAFKVPGKKVLLLTNGKQDTVYKSGRNISKVRILEAEKASTYDILNNQILIVQKSAVETICNSFKNKKEAVN